MYSGDYYLYACLDQIRELGSFYETEAGNNSNIRIMPDERPAPGCGLLFIGLRLGNQQENKIVIPGFSEKIEVVVHVTLRTTVSPNPEVGQNFYVRRDQSVDFRASIHHICRKIIDLIHNSNSLLLRVQQAICDFEGENAKPVTSPLRAKSISIPRIVDVDHFNEVPQNREVNLDSGLLSIITFGDGERLV